MTLQQLELAAKQRHAVYIYQRLGTSLKARLKPRSFAPRQDDCLPHVFATSCATISVTARATAARESSFGAHPSDVRRDTEYRNCGTSPTHPLFPIPNSIRAVGNVAATTRPAISRTVIPSS